MAKVLFIIPSLIYGNRMHMGVACLSAYAKKHGHEVALYDAGRKIKRKWDSFEYNDEEGLVKKNVSHGEGNCCTGEIKMKILIPQKSIKYILFQRTGYLKNNHIFNLLTHVGRFKSLYKLSIYIKSFLFSSKIKNEFIRCMNEEYLIIKPHLPKNIESILDIGCGIAGIDVLLSSHYENNVSIFLIDKTKIDEKIHYNFEETGSFYNSLKITKNILEINNIKPERIHIHEATNDNKIQYNKKFDIVISLISLGFHYPVTTYLNQIYQKLKPGGILILDIRKGSGGENEIKKKFGNCKIIYKTIKFNRVIAKK